MTQIFAIPENRAKSNYIVLKFVDITLVRKNFTRTSKILKI